MSPAYANEGDSGVGMKVSKGLDIIESLICKKCAVALSSLVNISARLSLPATCRTFTILLITDYRISFSCICMWVCLRALKTMFLDEIR